MKGKLTTAYSFVILPGFCVESYHVGATDVEARSLLMPVDRKQLHSNTSPIEYYIVDIDCQFLSGHFQENREATIRICMRSGIYKAASEKNEDED